MSGEVGATYVSVFDDAIVCESACRFDPATKRVSAIAPAEEADGADALTDEYVIVGGVELRERDGVVFDY